MDEVRPILLFAFLIWCCILHSTSLYKLLDNWYTLFNLSTSCWIIGEQFVRGCALPTSGFLPTRTVWLSKVERLIGLLLLLLYLDLISFSSASVNVSISYLEVSESETGDENLNEHWETRPTAMVCNVQILVGKEVTVSDISYVSFFLAFGTSKHTGTLTYIKIELSDVNNSLWSYAHLGYSLCRPPITMKQQ